MTKQEYVHIRNLAWDLLIDAKISSLPVNVDRIEAVYSLPHRTDCATRYDRMLIAADQILTIYGLNNKPDNAKHLAVRVLAPMIVMEHIDINSYDELMYYTDLPVHLARQRFNRLIELRQRGKFEASYLETQVLKQFSIWINHIRH